MNNVEHHMNRPADPGHRRPVAIDLFAGAGGLALGFERAGFDVVAAVEYDPVHAATHMFNFPLTDVLCRDISTVSKDELLDSARRGWESHYPDAQSWDGVVDAVIGGPSCQGFSAMGKQDVNDERNLLLLEFVRLVLEIRPKTFCMENVPGLLSPRFEGLRNRAFNQLQHAGYALAGHTGTLDASEFGVPQKRKRVIVLGALGGVTPGVPSPTTGSVTTVEDALRGLPNYNTSSLEPGSDLLVLSDKMRIDLSIGSEYLRRLNATPESGTHFGHRRASDVNILSGCRLTEHTAKSIERFRSTPQGKVEPISRAFRLDSSRPARTLRAGTGRERGAFSASRPLHPTEPRVVTVREAARLHSFPDWFRFHTTNWHGNRQIGNAVPPFLAEAAASALLRGMNLKPSPSRVRVMPVQPSQLVIFSPTQAAAALKADKKQIPLTRVEAMLTTFDPSIKDVEDNAPDTRCNAAHEPSALLACL